MDPEEWLEARNYKPEQLEAARRVLEEVRHGKEVWQAIRHFPLKGGGYPPKHILVAVYRQMVESGEWQEDAGLLARIRMKPVRTLSGVTTVTVLTKPYPCPGDCIFCPSEAQMPKSYISEEPGARRGLQNGFDPFTQVHSRLAALEAVGHPTDKVELLILGGTWSAYRRDYQEWFVKRCFDAMNETDLPTLAEAQRFNEDGPHRNVGLVIETRPDEINTVELAWLRRLGVTKVQMGAQSLDDRILALNRRGHTTTETLQACALLRAAGFKIVLHWMPNLLGATLASDREDFIRLWQGYCPDEIKIYPCELLESAELYHYWQRGEYIPYTEAELVGLIADVKPSIPRYCRVNRVIRDIPSAYVVAGNKRTSLRQDVQAELARRGTACQCLRCREVRGQAVSFDALRLDDLVYHPAEAEEHFLSFVTPDDHVAGYLRLSLPVRTISSQSCEDTMNISKNYEDVMLRSVIRDETFLLKGKKRDSSTLENHPGFQNDIFRIASKEEKEAVENESWVGEMQSYSSPQKCEDSKEGKGRIDEEEAILEREQVVSFLPPELKGAAIIREVHIYGQSLPVGAEQGGAAQHGGLGTRLIAAAEEIARQHGFRRLAVIAAVGTRQYYQGRGFEIDGLYMVKNIFFGSSS